MSHRFKTGCSISCPKHETVLDFQEPSLSLAFLPYFNPVTLWKNGLSQKLDSAQCFQICVLQPGSSRYLWIGFCWAGSSGRTLLVGGGWLRRGSFLGASFLPVSVCQLTNKPLLSCRPLHRKHRTVLCEADLAAGCFLAVACSSVELCAEFPL